MTRSAFWTASSGFAKILSANPISSACFRWVGFESAAVMYLIS